VFGSSFRYRFHSFACESWSFLAPGSDSDRRSKAGSYAGTRTNSVARKRQALKRAPSNPHTIPTAGEVFEDGTFIELVRAAPKADLELLLWNGTRAAVGCAVTHDSRVYCPAEFNSTILQRITIPVKQ